MSTFAPQHRAIRHNREQFATTVNNSEEDQTRVRMDDLTRVLLGSILRLLRQDMTRNHNMARAYLRQWRPPPVQRDIRAAVVAHSASATALTEGPASQPAIGPSYRPMELSLPHPTFFSPVARSDDLDQFYGRTVGVTPLPASGGAGTSQVRASAPPHGSAIIDLNISAMTEPPQKWGVRLPESRSSDSRRSENACKHTYEAFKIIIPLKLSYYILV
jgi:hypothetical protein